MSKILNDIVSDIVDEAELKPNRTKLIIKWTIRLSIVAIVGAYFIGQTGFKFLHSIDDVKNDVSNIKTDIQELKANDEKLEDMIKKNVADIDKNTDKIFEYNLQK